MKSQFQPLLLLFTVSMTAQVQLIAIVEVEEWVSDNPKKLVEMFNEWTFGS